MRGGGFAGEITVLGTVWNFTLLTKTARLTVVDIVFNVRHVVGPIIENPVSIETIVSIGIPEARSVAHELHNLTTLERGRHHRTMSI